MFKKIVQQNQLERQNQRNHSLEQKLMRYEAKLGGKLFGDTPAGEHREFFCLDEHTWVWHEEWNNKETGERNVQTTIYEVQRDRILKARDGQYFPVSHKEAGHLLEAARAYRDTVSKELYARV